MRMAADQRINESALMAAIARLSLTLGGTIGHVSCVEAYDRHGRTAKPPTAALSRFGHRFAARSTTSVTKDVRDVGDRDAMCASRVPNARIGARPRHPPYECRLATMRTAEPANAQREEERARPALLLPAIWDAAVPAGAFRRARFALTRSVCALPMLTAWPTGQFRMSRSLSVPVEADVASYRGR